MKNWLLAIWGEFVEIASIFIIPAIFVVIFTAGPMMLANRFPIFRLILGVFLIVIVIAMVVGLFWAIIDSIRRRKRELDDEH